MRGMKRWEWRGEGEGVAKKSERVTGRKKRKSAKCSRKRRRGLGARGLVYLCM